MKIILKVIISLALSALCWLLIIAIGILICSLVDSYIGYYQNSEIGIKLVSATILIIIIGGLVELARYIYKGIK